MFVPVTQNPPSPQAEDLGKRIALLIHDYCEENRHVNKEDVHQAFTVARNLLAPQMGGFSTKFWILIVMVSLGLAFALALLVFSLSV